MTQQVQLVAPQRAEISLQQRLLGGAVTAGVGAITAYWLGTKPIYGAAVGGLVGTALPFSARLLLMLQYIARHGRLQNF